MSMTTSFLNCWRKSIASRATHTQASGSSPLTWKIGAPIIFATSVQYSDDRESPGRSGETDLVVDDDVDRAAGAVAAQQRQVQRLGNHALTGERGVAVQHHRHDREFFGPVGSVALVQHVLLGAHQALEHRVDGLEVTRVGHQ